MAKRKDWTDKLAEVFQGTDRDEAQRRLSMARTIVNVLHPPKPKVKVAQSRKGKVNAKDTSALTEQDRANMTEHVAHSS